MTAAPAEPVGCEHLDGPYRKLLAEVQQYRAIEAKLRTRCAGLERPSTSGGVLASDLPTHELREAFGWPALPEPLDLAVYAADLDHIRAVREYRKD